jgi:drug/metabolite transporter (DMT)-like permease
VTRLEPVVYLLAVGAALCNALASVLQRRAAAPAGRLAPLALIGYLVQRPSWLLGVGAMLGGFAFQASALDRGSLAVVQPVLVSELLFVFVIVSLESRARVGPAQWLGAVVAAGGLAAFLDAADVRPGPGEPDTIAWAFTGAAVAGTVVVLAVAAGRREGARRAALLGSATAVLFAFTAALTKATVLELRGGLIHVLASWDPYGLALVGSAALFVEAQALQSGPLTASQPAFTLVDPLVSIGIGIALFGDRLETGPVAECLEVAGLIALAVGVVVLTRRFPDAPGPGEAAPGLRAPSAKRGHAATHGAPCPVE